MPSVVVMMVGFDSTTSLRGNKVGFRSITNTSEVTTTMVADMIFFFGIFPAAKSALGPNGRGNPIVKVLNANDCQLNHATTIDLQHNRTPSFQTMRPKIISVCATGGERQSQIEVFILFYFFLLNAGVFQSPIYGSWIFPSILTAARCSTSTSRPRLLASMVWSQQSAANGGSP